MISSQIIYYLLFFLLGLYTTLYTMNRIDKKISAKNRKEIEDIFTNIINNKSNIVFSKRINSYVYFKFYDQDLILFLKNQTIHLFKNEDCIASSNQIKGSEVIFNLIRFIKNNFYTNINNVININNNIYSKNLVTQKNNVYKNSNETIEEEYNLDDNLDRINEIGYDKLTETEKQFLKNIK